VKPEIEIDEQERRGGEKPVPENLRKYLNEAQLSELHHLESFGWELLFVRRPVFQETVAVIVDASGNIMGVLEKDGTINKEHEIVIRK